MVGLLYPRSAIDTRVTWGMGRITVVQDLLSFRVVLALSKKKESDRVSRQVLALLSVF